MDQHKLVQWIDSKRPTSGSFFASYAPTQGDGFFHAGWDAPSGAWYIATLQRCFGRDTKGSMFESKYVAGDLVLRTSPVPSFSEVLQFAISWPFLKDISDRPDIIKNFSSLPDGGMRVVYVGPGGSPLTPAESEALGHARFGVPMVTTELEVSRTGQLVRSVQTSPDGTTSTTEFAPSTIPDAPGSVQSFSNFQLVSAEHSEVSIPSRFDPLAVIQLGSTAALNIKRKQSDANAAALATSTDASHTGMLGQETQSIQTPTALTAAVLIIAIVAGVLYRRNHRG